MKALLIIDMQKVSFTTADRHNLTAKQLIAHYNWVWKEMTPTLGRIEVVDFESYISR